MCGFEYLVNLVERMLLDEGRHLHASAQHQFQSFRVKLGRAAPIAERAGMTTGAIYGNFKNREDLFIALGQTYWPPIKPRVKPGASFPDVMRAMAEATIAAIPDRAAAAVGRLTALAYTLTHEELRARVASVTAESYAFGEQWLREMVKKEDLPMPAGHLVRVIHALTEGLVFQRLLTPELVPDQVIRAAFLALAAKRH